MATSDQLWNLEGISQRSSEVRFDVLDIALNKVGEVKPDRDGFNPQVEHNVNRRINRTLADVRLNPGEQSDLDPLVHRIRPVWVLENGAEFPVGVYVFGKPARRRQEWGLETTLPGMDQTVLLDVALEATVAYGQGASVRDAIAEQFAIAGVPQYEVDPAITTQVANPISWPAGDDSKKRLDVINALAAMGGAYSAYFDNAGVGRVLRVPDLAQSIPTLFYGDGGRILKSSMVESDDLDTAPNRYIVVDTSTPDVQVTGFYDIPDDAPNSFARTGRYVTTTIPMQGLGDEADAVAAAQAAYVQDASTFQWVQFSSPPDARHDTHDVISYRDEPYREQGWRLPLSEGAEMIHDLRRVYGVTVGVVE